jgi:hypothetical protein
MMQTLLSCVNKGILKIHPSMGEIIISLKSAKNKPSNPYSKTQFWSYEELGAI